MTCYKKKRKKEKTKNQSFGSEEGKVTKCPVWKACACI